MIPGAIEIISLFGSYAAGQINKMMDTRAKAKSDEHQRLMDRFDKSEGSRAQARNYTPGFVEEESISEKRFSSCGIPLWDSTRKFTGLKSTSSTGFHFVRRTIALMVVGYVISTIALVAFGQEYSIAYGYIESSGGWLNSLFGSDGETVIKWVVFGNGSRILFYPPFINVAILSIVGFFFGSQPAANKQ